jgi:hypothetical protein
MEGAGAAHLQAHNAAQVDEHVWLVTFMHDDLGYFDDETGRLDPIDNPFGPKLLPMSPAVSVKVVVALIRMPHRSSPLKAQD